MTKKALTRKIIIYITTCLLIMALALVLVYVCLVTCDAGLKQAMLDDNPLRYTIVSDLKTMLPILTACAAIVGVSAVSDYLL